MAKRDLFAELHTGLRDAKAHTEGKLTLKTVSVTPRVRKILTASQIRAIRERYNMSRALFAHTLHISPRTLENGNKAPADPMSKPRLCWF